MKNLLILDTETTSLNPETGKLIEIAAIMYNVPTQTVLYQFSTLLNAAENPAYEVNRISASATILIDPITQNEFLDLFRKLIDKADAMVAHNASFDRSWLKAYGFPEKPWICTKDDFTWPVRKGTPSNLISIAVDLGVPVVSAHRALTDCQLIARCFDKLSDLEDRISSAIIPRSMYVADISYADRNLAKEYGFSWNSLISNKWAKRMTSEEAQLLPFPVLIES